MKSCFRSLVAALALLFPSVPAFAVEGGLGAYLPGSRDTFAGIVPGPGTYVGVDFIFSEGNVQGLSLGGLPIRADTDLKLAFTKISITQSFDAKLWGGQPAINVNIPFIFSADLDYTAVTPPLAGSKINDTASGLGDITITPMVGWTKGKLHYSAAFSIFAPTGSYDTAVVNIADRTIDALNTSKNIWSFQPVFSMTHFDPATGLEFSGAISMLFSTRNSATDYQNAPTLTVEGTAMQHTKSGWAFGLSGYIYDQIGNDSGTGARNTQVALGASSLSARVYGLGPIITYSGASIFGQKVDLKAKYYKEFKAKRRFESDTMWFTASLKF